MSKHFFVFAIAILGMVIAAVFMFTRHQGAAQKILSLVFLLLVVATILKIAKD